MDDAQNDDFVMQHLKEDCIRKATKDGAADLAVNAREAQRQLLDTFDRALNFGGEVLSKAWTPCFVPVSTGEKLTLSLRADDEPKTHYSPLSFLRTSSHGIPEAGSARCSLKRRSSSAACSGLSGN
jgi:hypothetical protein